MAADGTGHADFLSQKLFSSLLFVVLCFLTMESINGCLKERGRQTLIMIFQIPLCYAVF